MASVAATSRAIASTAGTSSTAVCRSRNATAAVIGAGHSRPIDVAEVNGRVFVNNGGVGLYPDMVRFREAEQGRGRSKRLAMLSASLRALRSFKHRRLWISAPGVETPIRTPLLFVGNNDYRIDLGAPGQRESIEDGTLSVFVMRKKTRRGLIAASIQACVDSSVFRDVDVEFLTYQAVMLAHSWALKHWRLSRKYTIDQYIDEGLALYLRACLRTP